MNLSEKFNLQDFAGWIEKFLPEFVTDHRQVDIPSGASGVKSINTFGESALGVRVFVIETDRDPSGRKIGLAKESFNLIKNYGTPNALIAYYSKESAKWRLSLLTSTPEWSQDKRKIITKLSNPKRQSYILGPQSKVNTPTRFLLKKDAATDIVDLKSRFSLEVVNKEFYKEISQSFIKLVGGTLGTGKNQKKYDPVLKLPSVADHSQTSIEFAVRLIGRIIFCWFLREKKSLDGTSLMPKVLVSLEAIEKNPDYYHQILEPIFFEVLNQQMKARRDPFYDKPYSLIPYLNGGLFSPHEDDFYKRKNGDFQSIFHNTLVIPDKWFVELFQTLETYNFTIDENTSFDEELSIDPEMLGRIFENLLAEINPETGESARKSTGSYYTPRVIVDYMVDESLLLYLKQQTEIEESKLRAIISYNLTDDAQYPLNEAEKQKAIDALEKVKILDPACGSGAFPIGALQKMVFILQQIDPEGQLWFRKQIQHTSPEIRRVLEREFTHKNFDYIRKLGVIRENIYGIDIQPIATEISRLRCFLTLVVDERIDDTLENRGIEPLPNLDFKFVTANSLIGLPKRQEIDKKIGGRASLFEDDKGIDDLKEVRDLFFNASGSERDLLKLQFMQTQKQMLQNLIGFGNVPTDLTTKLTTWDPFNHKTSDWFDPEWMFGVKDGFDVVIANPPYLRIQGIRNGNPAFADELITQYKSATGSFDLYVVFLEKGLQLVNKKGIVNYIMPVKWTNAAFGSGLRQVVSTAKSAYKIINFGSYQVFNASTYTGLQWYKRDSENLMYFELNQDLKSNDELGRYLNSLNLNTGALIPCDKLTKEAWVLAVGKTLEILNKLNKHPRRMGDIFEKIFQGLATSKDDVYFLYDCVNEKNCIVGFSKHLNSAIKIEREFTKPLLKGDDIHRYEFIKTNRVVVFPYKLKGDVSELYTEEEIESKFPLAYTYLKQCEGTLRDREKGRFNTDGKWFQFGRKQGISSAEKEKLLAPEISLGGNFVYDKNGQFYSTTTVYGYVKNSNISESYKCLMAILNSQLFWWYLTNTGTVLANSYFRFKPNYIKPFPFPTEVSKDKVIMLEKLVDKIQDVNLNVMHGNCSELEDEINKIVYTLYGLTSEEIKWIQNT